ncbi:MAG: hemerythrin domain-containing protein [Nitrospiraceae bacterium]
MGNYTADFRSQHGRLLEKATTLLQMAEQLASMPDGSRSSYAFDTRLQLVGLMACLSTHLVMEDQGLYPYMQRATEQHTRDIAKRFQEEMGGIGAVVKTYADKWTDDAMAASPDGFLPETKGLIAALGARIERENKELYPLADQTSFLAIRENELLGSPNSSAV